MTFCFRDVFGKHLNAVELDEFDIVPSDGGLSLSDAWKAADRGDETQHDLIRHAPSELLVETLLRELTPERVATAADLFHTLATSHLRQLHEMRMENEGVVGENW